MAFTRPNDPVTVQALEMAHAIARREGGVAYIESKAKEVSGHLVSREVIPERVMVREGSKLQPYRVTRTYPRAAVRRTVDKATLKRVYPHAYQAVVTVTKPEKPYQLRLEAVFGGKAAKEWSEEKATGADHWARLLQERYGELSWEDVSLQTRVLLELRRDAADQKDRAGAERQALIDFITANELPLVIRSLGDGRIVLRENGLRTSVNYDLLEREFPAAATLIKRNTTPGVPQIRFDKPKDDLEEGDDSDDSGWSIWKP
jgi:hypothetical protein